MPLDLSIALSLGSGGALGIVYPEMFTNPNFDTTDLSEWTAETANVAGAVVSSQLQVTNNGAGWWYRQFTVVPGATYRLTASWITKANGGRLNIGTTIGGNQLNGVSLSGPASLPFTPAVSTIYVGIGDAAGGAGTVNIYDTFSLKRTS